LLLLILHLLCKHSDLGNGFATLLLLGFHLAHEITLRRANLILQTPNLETVLLSRTWRVLLNLLDVDVGVGNKLHDLVIHVLTLPSEHLDTLILTDDPGVIEHILDANSLLGVLHQ